MGSGNLIKSAIEEYGKQHFEKRNTKIATKLMKEGVTEVLEQTVSKSENGFEGVFGVLTEQGEKMVVINIIIAGGYNVQRLHNRTLVEVR